MMFRPALILPSVAAVLAVIVVGSAMAFAERVSTDPAQLSVTKLQEEPDAPVESSQEDDDDNVGPGAGSVHKAQLLANEFGVASDAVMALHEQGVGWGALFKLYSIARATGASVDALIAAAPLDADGEREFAFGSLKKSLTDSQLSALDGGPQNFGQLVSGSKKHKKDQ